MTEMYRVRVMKESELNVALPSYRKTLESYLKSKSDHWKQEASGKKPLTE